MAEADDKVITPALLPWSTPTITWDPITQFAEARFAGAGGLRTDPHRHVLVDIDGPPPPSGETWLASAAKEMKKRPDHPDQITQAAKQFEPEMHEAFMRRQCDEQWGWDSIKHKLLKLGLWPRRRSPKQKERKLPIRHYIPEWKKRDGS
jgi:hypothetical protein